MARRSHAIACGDCRKGMTMATIASGKDLTTIVLDPLEVFFLRDILSEVEIKSRHGDQFAEEQMQILWDLWVAISDSEQYEVK